MKKDVKNTTKDTETSISQKTHKTVINRILNWILILYPIGTISIGVTFLIMSVPHYYLYRFWNVNRLILFWIFIFCLFLKLTVFNSSKNKKTFFNLVLKYDFILFIISLIALPIAYSIFPATEDFPGVEIISYPVRVAQTILFSTTAIFFLLLIYSFLKKLFLKSKKLFYITLFLMIITTGYIASAIYDYVSYKSEPCTDCYAKPIIYLYPTKTTEVSVKVGNPQNFTHTYPKYNDGWQVVAQPNGDLTDVKTGRSLYALYWEGEFKASQPPLEGFIVKGSDTIPFLEEKLAHLGLSERETNEMIIYWLPKLENNPYNFIRFQSLDEQNARMPLMIEPKPDTLIRVMMEFDDLDKPIRVSEQILPPTPTRHGFTVVEWGGREIDID